MSKTLHSISEQVRHNLRGHLRRLRLLARRRLVAAAGVTAAAGMLLGVGVAGTHAAGLQAQLGQQKVAVEHTRREAQREVNALAARLAELQAQTNRLNALGDRLARASQLGDGEFDFSEPVGIGGVDPVHDMPVGGLIEDMDAVESRLRGSGAQLSVLEALLLEHQMERAALPSRSPVASTWITSDYGYRADPFRGGRSFHRGIDFRASRGDPVMSVADGVVSFSGWRNGYGRTVEVDHGNGYITRYAHNSRNTVQVGDLVRTGQELAKAGSSGGRSTGTHVHFEVWEHGRVLNPHKFLDSMGVTRG